MISVDVSDCAESISMRDIVRPLLDEAKIFTVTRAYPLQPHCHPIFEMHYLHTGFLSWEFADGPQLNVRGGDVAVIPPNTRHRSLNDAETPSVFLSLSIMPDPPSPSPPFVTLEEQAEAYRILGASGSRVVHGHPELDAAFCALRNKASQVVRGNGGKTSIPHADHRTVFALSVLDTAILRMLLHQCLLRMLSALAKPGSVPHYTPVRRAIRFMNKNIGDSLSLSDLVRAARVSRSRFSALFHAETGQHPAEYLMRLRLDRSIRMLRDGRLSVTDIAIALGFASSQHFASSFRKYFGLSPTVYRRQARAQDDRSGKPADAASRSRRCQQEKKGGRPVPTP